MSLYLSCAWNENYDLAWRRRVVKLFFYFLCFLFSLPFHFAVKLGHSEILELTRRKQFNVQMKAYFGVKINLIIMFFSQNNDHKSFFFFL